MSTNLDQVLTRGVEQILPSQQTLADLISSRRIRLYLGIDPTGSLLHLGHSVVLRKLQQFADLGCEVILLIGNGTVRIGDPTGRDSTRPVLTDQIIEENFQTWKRQASKVLNFDQIEVRYNGDWLDQLQLPALIELMAKTTTQQLLERDMFQQRLAKQLPIYSHELIYPLLQGYDSVALDVDLEIGGSDQTFNMLMGRHLLKEYRQKEKWILSTPIINGLDGRKMSKSFNNYIALEENSRDMYGKLMSATDDVIFDYFRLLTDLPLEEIERMQAEVQAGSNPMEFKKLLAFTITQQYHDAAQAQAAADYFAQTIQQKQLPTDLPIIEINRETTWLDLAKLCRPDLSSSELKRLINQGSLTIIDHEDLTVEPTISVANSLNAPEFVIKLGKRHYFQIKLT